MTVATLKKVFLGGAFELALVYGIICFVLIITGSGKYSLDYHFLEKDSVVFELRKKSTKFYKIEFNN